MTLLTGIPAQSVDIDTTLSYRDAASHGDRFETMPSSSTNHCRVKEYGNELREFIADHLPGIDTDTGIPDGTKCYNQDDGRNYHDIQVAL